jgi:hypothetical protein
MLPGVANSKQLSALVFVTLATAVAVAQDVLPRPEPPFKGLVGRTVQDSTLEFPQEIKAPKGAPNISLIELHRDGYSPVRNFTRRHSKKTHP